MAAPTVSALAHVGSGTVNLFAKYYATFTLSKSYTANPDADTDITGSEVWIRADALCTAPSGRVLRVPCYWFQDYTETPGNPATYATTGTAGWRMFTFFDEVGSWTVAIEAEDVDGLTTSGTITVTVTDDGTLRGPMRRKGHLRVDGRGHQIWAFGNDYGTNEGASGLDGAALYARDAGAIADNGGNFARYVCIPRAANVLEWTATAQALGLTTWYAGLGKVSPKPAKRVDIGMNDAYNRGIYVTLCIDAHEGLRVQASNPTYMSWNATTANGGKHPWSVSGGGWIPDTTPELFFTDSQARLRYRRKMRWYVARYGGYYNVNWDLVNEADQVGNIDLAKTGHSNATVATAMNAWHIEMGRFLKRLDPHRKPIEHSYANGGFANADAAAAFGELDVDSHHHYAANVSQVISWPTNHGTMESINTYGQIADVGEYGVGPQSAEAEFDPADNPLDNVLPKWNTTAKRDRLIEGWHVMNYIAATMVYGAAARGWWWETYLLQSAASPVRNSAAFPMHQYYDKLGAFVVGEDWANMWPQPAPVTLTYDTTNLLANAAANAKHVYAYVHNKQLYYDNATAIGSLTNQTGKTLAIASGLTPGSWKYEVWDPKPGLSSASPAVVAATGYATSAAGALTIRLPAFTKAWLVKAWLSDGRRD